MYVSNLLSAAHFVCHNVIISDYLSTIPQTVTICVLDFWQLLETYRYFTWQSSCLTKPDKASQSKRTAVVLRCFKSLGISAGRKKKNPTLLQFRHFHRRLSCLTLFPCIFTQSRLSFTCEQRWIITFSFSTVIISAHPWKVTHCTQDRCNYTVVIWHL